MVSTGIGLKQEIRVALRSIEEGNFAEQAARLLGVLGYRSERTLPGQSGTVDEFLERFPAENSSTKSELEFREAAASIHFLFQVTDDEIADGGSMQGLLMDDEFQKSNVRSFLFTAVELKGDEYARGRYAAFTREINKRLSTIPSVVLFRTRSGHVTLAFVHVRPNKRHPERNVIGSVALIREVLPGQPHRAHVDILAELSLNERLHWMDTHGKSRNFDGLLAAWLDALDTEELNRRFYTDLKGWFDRAVKIARFPTTGTRVLNPEEHVIRLITRMLFVWFVKEKGMVAEDLFIETQVDALLRNFERAGDSYYRAVLQNLFFATLNTEIKRRSFSSQSNATHRDFSRYRYASEIADPDRILALFGRTPFINGGLFDCLDSEEATGTGGYRIDCFTDNPAHRRDYSIPNTLFFDEDDKAPGLITLFNHYKFTVEENTPAEQEVALDPELLGKVFENLLAAYNPETRETARKQTGSYYTPRAVVDYMVDEALVASLVEKVRPDAADTSWWKDRLHYLLDYNDAFEDAAELFHEAETEQIVSAIAGLRVLDPAVGSGAFPMGVLHKLTLALRRLDSDNARWAALQKEIAGQRAAAAFGTSNQQDRDKELAKISETFEHYKDSDFGRKLYLVQNSIYGVDIQPVATQIAKLRFFISLAIEQQPTDNIADNYGIKPLPNLETRFVAANTLLGLGQPSQIPLGGENKIAELNDLLRQNRERHFHAGVRQEKLHLRQEDARLRGELATELEKAGMPKSDAGKIAGWDPYDQNSHAEWFDAGYMFDVSDGFDVVIGNPPYVESRNSLISEESKEAYRKQVRNDWGGELPRGSDLLIYFLARSANLLHQNGQGCLITQNAWLSTNYGKAFQSFSTGKFSFERIIDTSARFFSDAIGPNINAVITLFNRQNTESLEYTVINEEMAIVATRIIRARQDIKWGHLFSMPDFFKKILSDMVANQDPVISEGLRFGQGVNIAKNKLNRSRATIPIIVKEHQFVASSSDNKVRESDVPATRISKIPALIMPRGVGNRHYCAFNFCRALSLSRVELYVPDHTWNSYMHYCLWAYLNSSFVWLFREITGRKNLGGGLLKAEATDMNELPIGFNFDFGRVAKEIFDSIGHREPLPVSQEVYTDEHLSIDDLIANFFGFTDTGNTIRDTLVEKVEARSSRARSRR